MYIAKMTSRNNSPLQKLDAHRHWDFHRVTSGFQFTGFLIDPKGVHVATGLIGRNQEFAGGVEAKIAGRFSQSRLMLHGL